MPVHTHKIGDFQFLEMQGSPYLRQQDFELIEREGVNGTGVRKLGQHGKPFQLQTLNYELTYTSAAAIIREYKSIKGDGPLALIRKSVNEGTFIVLQVVEVDCYPIYNAIGGLYGNEQCCQVVNWTLLG